MSLLFSPFRVPADLGGQFSEMLVLGGFAEKGTVSAELREKQNVLSVKSAALSMCQKDPVEKQIRRSWQDV